MTEPTDIPPAPKPVRKYTLVDYVFQFITITAGVLIALLINGLVEWNDNRELVKQARATIALEITANKKDLDTTLADTDADMARIDNVLKFANDMLAGRKTTVDQLLLNVNLADLAASGWRTAERTGALSHMAYAEVQKYSKLYDLQDVLVDMQRGMVNQLASVMAILGPDFDPDNPNLKDVEAFRERLMQLRSALTIRERMGKVLAENYAEALAKQ